VGRVGRGGGLIRAVVPAGAVFALSNTPESQRVGAVECGLARLDAASAAPRTGVAGAGSFSGILETV
jgi:hypothetical protein